MKKWLIIAIVAILIIGFIGISFKLGFFGPQQGFKCDTKEGEWVPQQGECDSPEMKAKCDEFCEKHPNCCPGWEGRKGDISVYYGLSWPSEKDIANLTRNYPETIKAINEGPNIYPKNFSTNAVINNKTLEQMKETGFNTVQIMLIADENGSEIVFNDRNNIVLLHNIIAIKKYGLAAWIVIDSTGTHKTDLGTYEEFKKSFIDFVPLLSELMEKYKVEYLTVNNEPDKPFKEQTTWGSQDQIEKNIEDFLPLTNAAAREKFKGKLINKITLPRKHTSGVIEASFKNVDIAGVDVGPSMSAQMSHEIYKSEFDDYQFYATEAGKRNVSWMNAEYWQGDFQTEYGEFVKNNELVYANISFNAYLAAIPKGVGYTWNEMAMFSLEPNGEKTKNAIKEFFNKI